MRRFGRRSTIKSDLHHYPTLVGGVNGGSEIVKMWKDYFKGIFNFDNSANESGEFVEHSIG